MSDQSPRRRTESRLFAAYRATGDARARDAVVEHFLPLARSLARRYRGPSEPLEDLEQVACLALVRAVDGFDASRGTAFSSYAVPSITGAIKRHFRDNGWAVRVPRELQELALRVDRLSEDLLNAGGEAPTVQAVARAARVSVEEVLEAREAMRALLADSVDRPRGSVDPDAPSLLETIGEGDEELAHADERMTLDAWLGALDDRDRAIVTLYYRGGLSQKEIGRRLGYSQMHVSRLLGHALERLREAADTQEAELATQLAAA